MVVDLSEMLEVTTEGESEGRRCVVVVVVLGREKRLDKVEELLSDL